MVRIHTLGDFDIKVGGQSILHTIGNQHRLMKLFKYFLTFNGKKLLPENIIEDIWEEENFKEPLKVLRTQISRLRNLINFKAYGIEPFFTIDFIDGYYLFELKENTQVDFLEMEVCIEAQNKTLDKEQILDVCKVSTSLYRGEFLGELGYEEWLIPIRNRLDRLYINSLTRYLQVLKEKSMDNHIVSICEDAMAFKPYEEKIHIYMIEALLNLGQNQCALNHYKYCTSKMYSDLGESPSPRLKDLYKTIKLNEDKNSNPISLGSLDEALNVDEDTQGALICDRAYFKFMYNFMVREKERKLEENVFLGIITIDKSGYIENSREYIKSSMLTLLDMINYRLRKTDVLTQWNDNQLLLLLTSVKEDNLESIINRLKIYFNSKISNDKITLNIKFKKI